MLTFTRLNIQGFCSIDSFSLQLNQDCTVLIKAPNGFGKSTLLNALVWALYGKNIKGVSEVNTAVGLFDRTRMTLWDWEEYKPKINAEAKRHFINGVRNMTEEMWDYSKRIDAIARIADSWVRKGESEKDVSDWMSECMLRDWDLGLKYEDWKYGRF